MALNVLVVDDSSVTRAMIIKTIRLSGVPLADVFEASHGVQALELLDQNWIDLALLDVNMPVMNGEDLLAQIRANPETADLPVIIISTEGSETRIARLRNLGAQFIRKPFTPETLREMVRTITGVSHEHAAQCSPIPGSSLDF